MCGVIGLGRGPRRLRLAEQLEQLARGQLRKGAVGRAGPDRREVRDAAAALRSRAVLEDETELIAAIDGDAAGRIDLPPIAFHCQRASGHRRSSPMPARSEEHTSELQSPCNL